MVHYKLRAFQGRGTTEPIRQIFALAGVDFENNVTDWYKWNEEGRNSVPFGQLPVLEEDGKQLPQSEAILRYVARKFGFSGATPWEEALVDAYADQWKDFNNELKPLLYILIYQQPGDLEEMKKAHLPSLYKHLELLRKAIKENPSGFIVGSSLTYIDLPLAEFTFNVVNRDPSLLKDYPELIQHKDKVQSIPALKKWIEERPKTDW